MKTSLALLRKAQAEADGTARRRAFDWDQAARIIRERKATAAEAGLEGDWEWTGGAILSDGKPVTDSYTYLGSMWCTPMLEIDGEQIECWRYTEASENYDPHAKWPESALAILNAIDAEGTVSP